MENLQKLITILEDCGVDVKMTKNIKYSDILKKALLLIIRLLFLSGVVIIISWLLDRVSGHEFIFKIL